MTDKTVIRELKKLRKEEHEFYKDKETQFVDYKKKRLAVIGGCRDTEFLLGLLYEVFSGQLYGDQCLVRVFLVDSHRNLRKVEFVYASIWTSGLPLFDGLYLTSDPKKALPRVEYVIIHPYIRWKKDLTREQIINDNFHFFRRLAEEIADCCREDVQVLLIGSRCMVPFRLILALYFSKLPMTQVHGLSRAVERAAASLIAHKMECNSNEVRGVAVFGEDIVDVESAWIEWDPECDEDLIDLDTIKYGEPEMWEWMERDEECREMQNQLQPPKGVEVVGLQPMGPHQLDIDVPPLVAPRSDGPGVQWDLGSLDLSSARFVGEQEEQIEEAREEESASLQKEEQQDGKMDKGVKRISNFKLRDSGQHSESYENMKEEQIMGEENWDKSDAFIHETKVSSSKQISDPNKLKEHGKTNGMEKKSRLYWKEWIEKTYQPEGKKPRLRWTFWDDLFFQGRTAATRFRESSKLWQCQVHPDALLLPKELKQDKQEFVQGQMEGRRWIINNIPDEKFRKGTVFKRCRHSLSGYSYAKAVICYIKKVLLSKNVIYTNEVVCSPGIYGIPEGLYSSFPVRIDTRGNCKIIKGYALSEITEYRIGKMVEEVMKDYEQVLGLFYNYPPKEAKRLWQLRFEEEEEMLLQEEDEQMFDMNLEEGSLQKDELEEREEEEDELNDNF